jgi:excinuclease ABC subunit B
VAILDADKEGFLRSHVSLIQTMGRAARHLEGRCIMYSDSVTESLQTAIDECTRRREVQAAYNKEHGITPTQVRSAIHDLKSFVYASDALDLPMAAEGGAALFTKDELRTLIRDTEKRMMALADDMEFEKAAAERDRLIVLREMDLGVKPPVKALLNEATEKQEQRPMGRKSQPRKYRRKR